MAFRARSAIGTLYQVSEMAAMFSVYTWIGIGGLHSNTSIGDFLPENQLVCIRTYAVGAICSERQQAGHNEPQGKRFPVCPVRIDILQLCVPLTKDGHSRI